MGFLKRVSIVFDHFLDFLMFVACFIFVGAMMIVCVDVVLRYIFNSPMIWATELCELILVSMASFGMAWLLRQEKHVKVDFFLNILKPRHQALLNGITSIMGAAAVLAITWYGLENTFHLMERGALETGVLRLPKAYYLMPLGIGCLLFFIQLVRRSHKYLRIWRKGGIEEG